MGSGAAPWRAPEGACARRGGAGRRRHGARTPGGWPRRRSVWSLLSLVPSSQFAQQNRCLALVIRHLLGLVKSFINIPIKKKSIKATYKTWDQTTKLSRLRPKFCKRRKENVLTVWAGEGGPEGLKSEGLTFFILRSLEACESVSE